MKKKSFIGSDCTYYCKSSCPKSGKTTRFSQLLMMAVMAMAAAGMAGCTTDDSLLAADAKGGGVTVNAAIQSTDSRLGFVNEDGKLKTLWNDAADTEKFSLHYAKGSAQTGYLFVKPATDKAKSAEFTCEGTKITVTAGTTVYAVYPGKESDKCNADKIVFSLKDQPGIEASAATTGDVGDFNFMVANATVPPGGLTSLSFEHKVALVKMELTFPADETGSISEITINSGDMYNEGTYKLSTGEWIFDDNTQKGTVSTKSGATFALDANNKVTAWLAVFPQMLTNVYITAKAGNDIYFVKMADATLDASKVYTVTKEMKKINVKVFSASNYYMWDAYLPYQYIKSGTWGPGSAWYNNGKDVVATSSCKDCPTSDDIKNYIFGGPIYWDPGYGTTENGLQIFITPKNNTPVGSTETQVNTAGVWLLKKSKWPQTVESTGNTVTPNKIDENNVAIRTNGDYFFLPAAGRYLNGTFDLANMGYFFWASNINSATQCRVLYGTNMSAMSLSYPKYFGCCVMKFE